MTPLSIVATFFGVALALVLLHGWLALYMINKKIEGAETFANDLADEIQKNLPPMEPIKIEVKL